MVASLIHNLITAPYVPKEIRIAVNVNIWVTLGRILEICLRNSVEENGYANMADIMEEALTHLKI